MSEIHSHSCIENHLYCQNEIKPASPFTCDVEEKPQQPFTREVDDQKRQPEKKKSMLIRLQRSLLRKTQHSTSEKPNQSSHQMAAFHTYSSQVERRDMISLPPSLDQPHPTAETIITDDPLDCNHIERKAEDVTVCGY